MRLSWKLFIAATCVAMAIYMLFGGLLINASFQSALNRQIEKVKNDNNMVQYAFQLSYCELTVGNRSDEAAEEILETIAGNGVFQKLDYRVYKEAGELLYGKQEPQIFDSEKDIPEMEENAYKIEKIANQYLISVISCKTVMGNVFYFETVEDITGIYQDRTQLYDTYRMLLVAVLVVFSVVISLVMHAMTRPLKELSLVTRKMAEGDYTVRGRKVGDDEIGDLTEDFNSMADSLEEKILELTEAARKQEDFTSSFAHELKTPLTSIIGYADMLRSLDLSKEEEMEAAHYIYTQGKRLESLSFKLLDLIVMKRVDLEMKPIAVERLVNGIAKLEDVKLKEKEIRLQTEVEPGYVAGDYELLISMLNNLVDNARKAVEQCGKITITGARKDGMYYLTVADNGKGIEKEEVPKLTEAFYMVDKSRSRKEGGAGLGLTLCSRILELHKGTIQIESEVGKGTTITVGLKEAEHEEMGEI